MTSADLANGGATNGRLANGGATNGRLANGGATSGGLSRAGQLATVRTFLRLLEEKDIDAWIELWAPDADHYYPFGTEMFPHHIVGKAAIHGRWKDTPGMFTTMRFPIRESWADGDTVLARFDGECVLKGSGTTYRNSYLGIFKFDEHGLIREYWEYFDPITAGIGFGLADVSYTATVPASR